MSRSPASGKTRIVVDGKTYEVKAGDNLLQACLSQGLDLPYFCWHPALGSVGACRQCAVKTYQDEKDDKGRLVMSCMTPVTEKARLSIADEEAVAFRESVVEFLMVNHPHDCAVCEEGGECHLQDMTVMTGHDRRRYRFTKRTHRNQNLGPCIGHEMNRCIACYRCVRYYRDYAGGEDLNVFGAHDNVYFGRSEDGTLQSPFSGNLVEVCPTGVFTDKTLSQRYTRKWDLQTAPSVCVHCAVGCNTSPGERYGELRRISNRYHGEINGYFLCDRGRFGYGHVNRSDRPRQLMLRLGDDADDSNAAFQPVPAAKTQQALAQLLKGAERILGIGSPRASLESNFALRELVGPANFFSGASATEQLLAERIVQIYRDSPAKPASLRDIENADMVLLLGEDIGNTAPRMALAVRQTVRARQKTLAAGHNIPAWQADAVATAAQASATAQNPLFVITAMATGLDALAEAVERCDPDSAARLGQAVAHRLGIKQSKVKGLSRSQQQLTKQIAEQLMQSERPVIISGTNSGDGGVIEAAANIAWALKSKGKQAKLAYALPEVNSLGAAMLGGGGLQEALGRMGGGAVDAVIVLENDLYQRATAEAVDYALDHTSRLIVLDHQTTATTERAIAVVPAAGLGEGDGSLVNYESRVQRSFQVFDPQYFDPESGIAESWRWLQRMAGSDHWQGLDDITQACAQAVPALAEIVDAAPLSDARFAAQRMPRMTHRASGRTAMRAGLCVQEPRPVIDLDTALNFSMEGYNGAGRPAALTAYAWAPGWNSPQAWNKFQEEVAGALKGGDPGIRLLKGEEEASYFFPPREPEQAGAQWQLLVMPQIFGSEELSRRVTAIQARQNPAVAGINAQGLATLGLAEGDMLNLEIGARCYSLPVRCFADLPDGWIGLPQGLQDVPDFIETGMPLIAEAAEEIEL